MNNILVLKEFKVSIYIVNKNTKTIIMIMKIVMKNITNNCCWWII